MPRLHLVTGHRLINRSDAPCLLYLGHDADAASKAQDAAITIGRVLIAERYIPTGPVTRYSDKKALLPVPATESLGVQLIPVELGEGEGKVVINVATEADADFLKMLAKSAIEAGKMIDDIRAGGEELRAAGVAAAGEVVKLEGLLTSATGKITQLEAELQRETAYKTEVNQRIATLEADLKAAQEKVNAPATTGTAQGDLLTQPPSTPAKKKSS